MSPRRRRWEIAKRERAGWRQKAADEGVPRTRRTLHGARKARSSISRSDATARQSRHTHAARARSAGRRNARIDRRRSPEESAEKWEFMGEITSEDDERDGDDDGDDGEGEVEEEEEREASGIWGKGLGFGVRSGSRRLSSLSSPQHPMVGSRRTGARWFVGVFSTLYILSNSS